MYVFYEEGRKLKVGLVLKETQANLQIEITAGKTRKIKREHSLFFFSNPKPEILLMEATEACKKIEASFLWECVIQEKFNFHVLAKDYYGHEPSPVECASILFRINSAPIYFNRCGAGWYCPTSKKTLLVALEALKKKEDEKKRQQEWTASIIKGNLPLEIASIAKSLIISPKKNSLAWKALESACKHLKSTPEALLVNLGVWPHALALHRERFFKANFPQGTEFPQLAPLPINHDLPLVKTEIYSIDDISTTEIDDAFSVVTLPGDVIMVGIHIAAPGLSVTHNSDLDMLARKRLSTLYLPGSKVTMQPSNVIQAFSLNAGREVPALSLYATANATSGNIINFETRLERIIVKENLRHSSLEKKISEEALTNPKIDIPYENWFRPLWKLASALHMKRQALCGNKINASMNVEYSFYFEGDPSDPDTQVELIQRQRHAPLNRMVAEYMNLANSLWGSLLYRNRVPAIYRFQQRGRARMGTQALPHESVGAPQYIWATSPLRRYVDLVNQRQLISIVNHGVSARLATPFKSEDTELHKIVRDFEIQNAKWTEFQNTMERYWCLRWLKQQNLKRLVAYVLRGDTVRLASVPLVSRVDNLPSLARETAIEVDIVGMDELKLEVRCHYVGLCRFGF